MSNSELKVQVLQGNTQVDLAKLRDVLSRKLKIPSYQRYYAWEKEDIDEIFSTIKFPDEEVFESEICFFGSVILSSSPLSNLHGQEQYYIVDGQQRISSFLLILRVLLNRSKDFKKNIEKEGFKEKDIKKLKTQIQKSTELEKYIKEISDLIENSEISREKSDDSNQNQDEQSIFKFIKTGNTKDASEQLKEKIDSIEEKTPTEDSVFTLINIILNNVRFCLICITGKDAESSESFAINLFNTLNTTGEPLTAFEVLKSKLHYKHRNLSKKVEEIQEDIRKRYNEKRKKITNHTGQLLLYTPLYRGEFNENKYKLSNKNFKDQIKYLEERLHKNKHKELVEDIINVNDFYSNLWLEPASFMKNHTDKYIPKLCLQFLSELNHDRVLPLLVRFKKNDQNLIKCLKFCTAFSVLWRAYSSGRTASIDNAYKEICKDTFKSKIEDLSKKLRLQFFKRLNVKNIENIEEARSRWIDMMKTSNVYKNQKLSKFLLFLSYNKKFFDSKGNRLKSGSNLDILNPHYWSNSDYKTVEHIIPQAKGSYRTLHTLGNLTLLPASLNSSLKHKGFDEKQKKYKNWCSKEKEHPYLPLMKQLVSYDKFEEKEIEERSKILSEFVWEELVEKWLEWKK